MKIGFVGETNAGKSTLFNKFFGSFRAIVSDISGTTRENICEKIRRNDNGDYASIYDSPGLDAFAQEFEYIKKIIDLADIVVFVIDGNGGINENINMIASYIRKTGKSERTVLAINKIDTTSPSKINLALSEFYILGFENMIAISAKNNFHLVELKEKIIDLGEKYGVGFEKKEQKNISFSLLGRINVGKSTLFNSLIGKEWSKVSSEGGTTLDYMSYVIEYGGKNYEIVDTAGFRRKGKIHGIEKIAVLDKLSGMLSYKKPIIVVLFDISEGITHRDMTVLGEMLQKNLPIILALNKIDDVEESLLKNYRKELKNGMRFAPWIPIVMISGKEKKGFKELFKMIDLVASQTKNEISTGKLNELIQSSFIQNPPKLPKNISVKVKYMFQDKEIKNRFVVFVNRKSKINFAFKKWLENIIRSEYGFFGTPLIFDFRDGQKREDHLKG